MKQERRLDWDWYPGSIPDNVILDEAAYVETSYSFHRFRSQLPNGVEYGRGAATYLGTMFDVGPAGHVKIGDYALVHGAHIICDKEVLIGDYSIISWNVALMDTYRVPKNPSLRRSELELVALRRERVCSADIISKPININCNVWIGFDTCVLPGVTIGEGSIIGAKSVILNDVPPYCVFAGNPARLIRHINEEKNQNHENELLKKKMKT
jgi:acetyltransferase-like isoleucine patch superfamily enzyme